MFRRCLGVYLLQSRRLWNRVPASLQRLPVGRSYGSHLHALVRRRAERQQYFATFFLRNRAELELIRRLADQKTHGSKLDISVLACSKGAEVYSILWIMRSARPDLKISMHALDIAQDILEFAERGVYSLTSPDAFNASNREAFTTGGDVTWNTCRDQMTSMFERMTREETEAMFELTGDQARIRPWLKEGITWVCGDAASPEVGESLGPQDIVMANRFLCHMKPAAAEGCLRNLARLVKPGGYLFVSGIDLDVRTRVARAMGWRPVMDLMRDIHEGDPSLRSGWPLEYWGLEPFDDDRPDWKIRYASVFQIGETA
jgi:chemotaxis methyl-accepting protein methylase